VWATHGQMMLQEAKINYPTLAKRRLEWGTLKFHGKAQWLGLVVSGGGNLRG